MWLATRWAGVMSLRVPRDMILPTRRKAMSTESCHMYPHVWYLDVGMVRKFAGCLLSLDGRWTRITNCLYTWCLRPRNNTTTDLETGPTYRNDAFCWFFLFMLIIFGKVAIFHTSCIFVGLGICYLEDTLHDIRTILLVLVLVLAHARICNRCTLISMWDSQHCTYDFALYCWSSSSCIPPQLVILIVLLISNQDTSRRFWTHRFFWLSVDQGEPVWHRQNTYISPKKYHEEHYAFFCRLGDFKIHRNRQHQPRCSYYATGAWLIMRRWMKSTGWIRHNFGTTYGFIQMKIRKPKIGFAYEIACNES